MNLQTIATNLASVIGTVTATNGSETESLTATAELPDTIAQRALLVFPPSGDLALIMGPRLDDHYTFRVALLRDPVAMGPRTRWLYAWATALRTRVQSNIDLDTAGVVEAQAVSMRMDFDDEQYGFIAGGVGRFDVVELFVDVHVQENTSAAI